MNNLRVLVFCDVSGSVRMTSRVGDKKAFELIERRLADVFSAMRAVDASVEQQGAHEGDSVFLHANQLVPVYLQALEIQTAYRKIDLKDGEPPLALRFAIGYGEIQESSASGFKNLSGMPISLTARLLDQIGPGDIAVTSTVRDRLMSEGGLVRKLQRREAKLDGFDDHEAFYVVTWREKPDPAPVHLLRRIYYSILGLGAVIVGAVGYLVVFR